MGQERPLRWTMLSLQAQERVAALYACKLFGRLGQGPEPGTLAVSSIEEAYAGCVAPEWEDLRLEASNLTGNAVRIASRERYRQWNMIVRDVKRLVEPIIDRDLINIPSPPRRVISAIRWDIVACIVAAEYDEFGPQNFYSHQLNLYLEGRLPCGWEGRFPAGRFIIY